MKNANKINIILLCLCYVTTTILSAKQSQQRSSTVNNYNNQKCSISEYTCANNKCISLAQFCDNNDDCGDNSDEPRFCTRKYLNYARSYAKLPIYIVHYIKKFLRKSMLRILVHLY